MYYKEYSIKQKNSMLQSEIFIVTKFSSITEKENLALQSNQNVLTVALAPRFSERLLKK